MLAGAGQYAALGVVLLLHDQALGGVEGLRYRFVLVHHVVPRIADLCVDKGVNGALGELPVPDCRFLGLQGDEASDRVTAVVVRRARLSFHVDEVLPPRAGGSLPDVTVGRRAGQLAVVVYGLEPEVEGELRVLRSPRDGDEPLVLLHLRGFSACPVLGRDRASAHCRL